MVENQFGSAVAGDEVGDGAPEEATCTEEE